MAMAPQQDGDLGFGFSDRQHTRHEDTQPPARYRSEALDKNSEFDGVIDGFDIEMMAQTPQEILARQSIIIGSSAYGRQAASLRPIRRIKLFGDHDAGGIAVLYSRSHERMKARSSAGRSPMLSVDGN